MKFEATLVCESCENTRVDLIDEEKLDHIIKGEALVQMCSTCHQETGWSLAEEERRRRGLPKRAGISRRADEDRRAGIDKRRNRRVQLHIPIEVRYSVAGLEFREETTSVNITRTGLYFLTSAELRYGMTLSLVLPRPLLPDPKNPVMQARVARIDEQRGDGPKYGIGVEYLGVAMEF